MAILSKKDFDTPPNKKASSGPYAGLTRYEIVQKKIDDKRDFGLGSNGSTKIVGISFDPKTKLFTYRKKIGKKEEITVPIIGAKGNICKDEDFGGGGGAGGGTLQTALAESAQCMWNAAVLAHPQKKFGDFTKTMLKTAWNQCEHGSGSFDLAYDGLDESWMKSGFMIAKELVRLKYINKTHVFHRGSTTMKKIYDQRKSAYRNSDMTVVSEDKWNPGDIWAIKKNFDVSKLDNSNIGAYNKALSGAFKDKTVIGISLKLVKRNIRTKVLNETDQRPDDLSYNRGLVKGEKTRTTNFFSNKAGIIVFDGQGGGTMSIRTSAEFDSHKIEIVLKTARGGGCGWGIAVDIVKGTTGKELPSNASLRQRANDILKGKDSEIKKMWNMSKTLGETYKLAEFKTQLMAQDAGWIHSKLGALELLYELETTTKAKKDKIVNQIYNYAGSELDTSSIYVKVYE